MGKLVAKTVNGKVIRINIDMFEKAAEGSLLCKMTPSNIKERVPTNIEWVNKCIEIYQAFFMALPYPMYAVESNVKYAAAGELILEIMGDKAPNMWVNNALFAELGDGKALKLMYNYWSIVEEENSMELGGLRLDDYTNQLGYEEYRWLLDQVMQRKPIDGFYQKFFPDFIKACNGDENIIRWELGNILSYGYVPDKMEFKENVISDIDNMEEYIIDIYYHGESKVGTMTYIPYKQEPIEVDRTAPVYDFKLMKKQVREKAPGKLEELKEKYPWAIALFINLVGRKKALNRKEFEGFKAMLANSKIIFQIGGRLYVTKAYTETEIGEIAVDIELFSYRKGIVYFKKQFPLGNGVTKVQIFSLSLSDGSRRLCKSMYEVSEKGMEV